MGFKWIKNNSGTDSTYQGQLISPAAYYQIQNHEVLRWQNDSLLLTAIGSGDALVAKDNSGTEDITLVADAINYLKDITTPLVTDISGVKDPKGMRARLVGVFNETVAYGTTQDLDWQIPQLSWLGTSKTSYFDGLEYMTDGTLGDTCNFQVVDKDGLVYPPGTVLEEFGTNFYLIPNSLQALILYKALLVPGMYLRLAYTSIGTTDVKVICNVFRHLDGNS